ncbi:MAG: protocatechuate 3,4-dioxygenase [Alphaproteobacteria bacterium]|nr:protocatechuate 3,4-dioxygenase [Alphaproteobacteria bacterium]
MARIIGGLTTSHVPSIGKAIAQGQQKDPYWREFFAAFDPVHAFLAREKPDVAIVIYNDHGLNNFLDKMPTFAIGAAADYHNADEGWGIPVLKPFKGDPALSWHLIEHLVAHDFDITMCQEVLVDHAFTLPMALMYPGSQDWPVTTVPVMINSVQHPLPNPRRCYHLGQAIGQAIAHFPADKKIMLVGTGGLSHQLDGTRAGFINKPFDLWCMEHMRHDPEALAALTIHEIIEKAGSQGVELLTWITLRAALQSAGEVSELHSTYHVPISNTGGAVMLFETRQSAQSAKPMAAE